MTTNIIFMGATPINHRSRHMVVCRAAQENEACANGVSILTGTTKSRF